MLDTGSQRTVGRNMITFIIKLSNQTLYIDLTTKRYKYN